MQVNLTIEPMRQGMKSVSDQLREAIEAGPMSRRQISKATGLDESVLSRFVHGKSGLAVPSIDKVCKLLRLELRPIKKPRVKKG